MDHLHSLCDFPEIPIFASMRSLGYEHHSSYSYDPDGSSGVAMIRLPSETRIGVLAWGPGAKVEDPMWVEQSIRWFAGPRLALPALRVAGADRMVRSLERELP